MICRSCPAKLSAKVVAKAAAGIRISGLCKYCYEASIRIERKCCECGAHLARTVAVRCQPCNIRLQHSNPDFEAKRLQRSRDAIRRLVDRRLAWCPAEHRAEFIRLRRRSGKRVAMAAVLSRMTPFEAQLARVMAGATVSAKFVMPEKVHGFTLGGVSGAML